MRKVSNNQWILLFVIAVFWILMIQVAPRFLPFNFGKTVFWGIKIHTDYVTHTLLFIAIVLMVNALRLKIRLWFLLPIYIFIAILAEVIQVYIPNRTFNYWDLASNIAGVIIGVVVVWGIDKVKRLKVKS